jgi:putative DNA primase/helicase
MPFIPGLKDTDKPSTQQNGQHFLDPRHLADLRASGLRDATIEAAGLRTVVAAERAAKLLNRRSPGPESIGRGPWLMLPFPDADGQPTGYARLKPLVPRKDEDGKPVKYESPADVPNRAHFPPGTIPALINPAVPLVITEGEKKSLKADQDGFPCVGLVGVWCWQRKRPRDGNGDGTGPRELIDDLRVIVWAGRVVSIAFDSDAVTNDSVLRAEHELALALRAEGARVRVVRLPGGEGGVP